MAVMHQPVEDDSLLLHHIQPRLWSVGALCKTFYARKGTNFAKWKWLVPNVPHSYFISESKRRSKSTKRIACKLVAFPLALSEDLMVKCVVQNFYYIVEEVLSLWLRFRKQLSIFGEDNSTKRLCICNTAAVSSFCADKITTASGL